MNNPTSAPESNGSKIAAAAAVTVLCWASAFIAIRSAGPHYSAGSMALLRMLVGTIALGFIVLRNGFVAPPKKAWLGIAAWGIGWFCLYNLALNQAERMIDAGTAAMLVNLAPLMVIVIGGFLGEGFTKALLIGAPISFFGVVLIGMQHSGNATLSGLLLALLAAVLYAGCTLIQKQLLKTVDSVTLTWTGAALGTAALLPWTGAMIHDLGHAPASATASGIYMGIFPTAIAFTTWAYVLKRSSAGKTSATTYVVPALAILMGWALLGETPTALTIIGGVLCLLGVFITRLAPRAGRA